MKIISYPSPHFDTRQMPISCIVIHYTDTADLQNSLKLLCDPSSSPQVSAHYLVDDDGTIYQLVAEEKRAWHAGKSCWRGQDNVNHFSIGIELQYPGYAFFKKYHTWPLYKDPQMNALISLLKDLQKRYSIPLNNIVGHCHIAPQRKIDPGPCFDWSRLQGALAL